MEHCEVNFIRNTQNSKGGVLHKSLDVTAEEIKLSNCKSTKCTADKNCSLSSISFIGLNPKIQWRVIGAFLLKYLFLTIVNRTYEKETPGVANESSDLSCPMYSDIKGAPIVFLEKEWPQLKFTYLLMRYFALGVVILPNSENSETHNVSRSCSCSKYHATQYHPRNNSGRATSRDNLTCWDVKVVPTTENGRSSLKNCRTFVTKFSSKWHRFS